MRASTAPWVHWTLFALAVTGVVLLIAAAMWELHLAYVSEDLTRNTLLRAFAYVAGILGLLWAAGFVVATRPRPQHTPELEAFDFE